MPLRFVHISDIHFGQEILSPGSLTLQAVREALISDCLEQKLEHGPADGVIVTGDLAFSGRTEEYDDAREFLSRLADSAGCGRGTIYLVPGNHDVNWSQLNVWEYRSQQEIRKSSPNTVQAELLNHIKEIKKFNPLKKLESYRTFALEFDCDIDSAEKPYWHKDIQLEDGYTLRLWGLSSVHLSNHEDQEDGGRPYLALGHAQYMTNLLDRSVEHIVLMHHPLECFIDQVDARNSLRAHARILMYGHRHSPDSEARERILFVEAGAVNPPEADRPYTYNWMTLNLGFFDGPGKPILEVTIHPRCWIPAGRKFDIDTKHPLQSRGKISRQMRCDNFESMYDKLEPKDKYLRMARRYKQGWNSEKKSEFVDMVRRIKETLAEEWIEKLLVADTSDDNFRQGMRVTAFAILQDYPGSYVIDKVIPTVLDKTNNRFTVSVGLETLATILRALGGAVIGEDAKHWLVDFKEDDRVQNDPNLLGRLKRVTGLIAGSPP